MQAILFEILHQSCLFMTRATSELRKAQSFRPEGADAVLSTREAENLFAPEDVAALRKQIQALRDSSHPLCDEEIDRLWEGSGVAGIVRKMDGMDTWAVDKVVTLGIPMPPEVEVRVLGVMKILAETLYSNNEDSINRLYEHRVDVAHFLCHLRSSRALAAFRGIIERAPRVAISLIQEVSTNASAPSSVFISNLYERLRVMERTRVLSRVFSPSRVAELLEIMDIKSGKLIE